MADSGGGSHPGKIVWLWATILFVVGGLISFMLAENNHAYWAIAIMLVVITIDVWLMSYAVDSDLSDRTHRGGVARTQYKRPTKFTPTRQPLTDYAPSIDWKAVHARQAEGDGH